MKNSTKYMIVLRILLIGALIICNCTYTYSKESAAKAIDSSKDAEELDDVEYTDEEIQEICEEYSQKYNEIEPILTRIIERLSALGVDLLTETTTISALKMVYDTMKLSNTLDEFMVAKERFDALESLSLSEENTAIYEETKEEMDAGILKVALHVYDLVRELNDADMGFVMPVSNPDVLFGDW